MKRFFVVQIFLLMITACGYLISNISFADESYPYGQSNPNEDLKKNWGRWERERYWDRDEGLRGEGPRGHGGRGREKGLR